MKHQHFRDRSIILNIPAESLETARQYVKEKFESKSQRESDDYKSYTKITNLEQKSKK